MARYLCTDSSAPDLGLGFDPIKGETVYHTAYKITDEPKLRRQGRNAVVDVSMIDTATQSLTEQQIDVKLAASFLAFHADTEVLNKASVYTHKRSVSWVISVKYDYGIKVLPDCDMTAWASKLSKNVARFVATYGSEYIVAHVMGSRVAVLYTFEEDSDSSAEELQGQLSGSVNLIRVGGSLSVDLRRRLSNAYQRSALTVRTLVNGEPASGAGSMAPAFKDPTDLPAVREALLQYFSGFGPANAVPTSFITQPHLVVAQPELTVPDYLYQGVLQRGTELKEGIESCRTVLERTDLNDSERNTVWAEEIDRSDRLVALVKATKTYLECQRDDAQREQSQEKVMELVQEQLPPLRLPPPNEYSLTVGAGGINRMGGGALVLQCPTFISGETVEVHVDGPIGVDGHIAAPQAPGWWYALTDSFDGQVFGHDEHDTNTTSNIQISRFATLKAKNDAPVLEVHVDRSQTWPTEQNPLKFEAGFCIRAVRTKRVDSSPTIGWDDEVDT